jgi:hypothetical protein
MSPIADTFAELVARMPEVLAAWILFALVPVLVPGVLAMFMKGKLSTKMKFTLSVAARLLGWPVLLIAFVGLPWFAFEMFFVPVLFDAYPLSKFVLGGPLMATQWLTWQSYWLVPLAWLAWVFFASVRLRKCWEATHNAG